MPNLLPSTPAPASIKLSSIVPNESTITHSGIEIVDSRGGHRWAATLDYPPMIRETFQPVWGFFESLMGRYGTFYWRDPRYTGPLGAIATAVTVASTYTSGVSSITISTGDSSSTVFLTGDFVKFAGHDKIYMVRSDTITDAAGSGSLLITPPLMASVSASATVYWDPEDIKFLMMRASDTMEFSCDVSGFHRYSVDIIEKTVT